MTQARLAAERGSRVIDRCTLADPVDAGRLAATPNTWDHTPLDLLGLAEHTGVDPRVHSDGAERRLAFLTRDPASRGCMRGEMAAAKLRVTGPGTPQFWCSFVQSGAIWVRRLRLPHDGERQTRASRFTASSNFAFQSRSVGPCREVRDLCGRPALIRATELPPKLVGIDLEPSFRCDTYPAARPRRAPRTARAISSRCGRPGSSRVQNHRRPRRAGAAA